MLALETCNKFHDGHFAMTLSILPVFCKCRQGKPSVCGPGRRDNYTYYNDARGAVVIWFERSLAEQEIMGSIPALPNCFSLFRYWVTAKQLRTCQSEIVWCQPIRIEMKN